MLAPKNAMIAKNSLLDIGIGSIDRLRKKYSRNRSCVAELQIDEDDIDDIEMALQKDIVVSKESCVVKDRPMEEVCIREPLQRAETLHFAEKNRLAEAYSRQVLEEEVSRLRHLSMEYKSQIDSLRRTSVSVPATPAQHYPADHARRPSTVPSAAAESSSDTATTTSSNRPIPNVSSDSHSIVSARSTETVKWSDAWDNESEGQDDNLSANVTQAQSDATTVQLYEKNLAETRLKMKQGVKAVFWEGQKVSNAEIIMKLDQTNRLLIFESVKKTTSIFQLPVFFAPLYISEISELIGGADIKTVGNEDSLCITIVSKASQYAGNRIIALRFVSRDMRNTTLTNLRRLVGDLQVTLSNKASSSTAGPSANPAAASSAAGRQISEATTSNPAVNPMAKQRNSSINYGTTNATGELAGTNPMRRAAAAPPARRLSVREVALEQKQAAEAVASFRRPSNLATPKEYSEMVNSMKKQLDTEKEKHHAITIQMLTLTNDLHERDEQIAMLKKKEEQFEQILIDRDNMFKQDALVRMQLGKKLVEVLMDKEEALEQLQLMQEKLDNFGNV